LWSIPVAELERITIVNFVENATVSSKTLGNRLSVLRSALDAAITDKMIRLNPLIGFKLKDHIKIAKKKR
jgi:integrase